MILLKNILDLFLKATGMVINDKNYSIAYEGLLVGALARIEVLFPYKVSLMGENLKYLAFTLNRTPTKSGTGIGYWLKLRRELTIGASNGYQGKEYWSL